MLRNNHGKKSEVFRESEITKIVNGPDSDLSSDESVNNLCFSDCSNSEVVEVYDINDPVNVLRVSEWNMEC